MKIFPFLLFLLLLSGCIKEDMDDCKGSISLDFSYTADGNTQVFNEYIGTVDLYVFDAEGRYVYTRRLEGGELQSRRTVLDLKPGHYHIVGVGNLGEKDQVRGLTLDRYADLTQTVVAHKAETENADGNPTGDDALYMGAVDVEVTASGDASRTVEFHNRHINMVVEVVGAARDEEQATQAVPAWNQLGIKWTNLPSETDLAEGRVGGPLCDYEPSPGQYDEVERKLTSALNVMRFDRLEQGTRSRLVVTNLITGATIETVDVMEFITDNHIDLDREEVTIGVLIVISKDGEISVELPDWVIEEVKPGL